MAVTTVTSGLNQTKGIPYTVITDSSADWASVANDTYFYDIADGLPHYKDSSGTVLEVFGGGDASIVSISGKKASAGTIAKGLPVYLVGFDSDLHTVELANANSSSTMPVIGFTEEQFNNTDGKSIITYGKLEGVDTTSTVSTLNPNGETWAVNDALYMSTTTGGLTKVRPTGATSSIQRIAKVLKVDATGGQIFIFNTARTAGLPNLTTDKIWVGDANGIPQEVDKSSLAGVSGSGTTNYVVRWTPDGSTLGVGVIRDDGTSVGVGAAPNASQRLRVEATGSQYAGAYIAHTKTQAGNVIGGQFEASAGTSGDRVYGITGNSNGGGSAAFAIGVRGSAMASGDDTEGLTAVGVLAYAGENSNNAGNISTFLGQAEAAHANNTYGIYVNVSNAGAGNAYLGRLQDGSEGAGKFIKSIDANGTAQWAQITASDITSGVSGSGTTNYVVRWSPDGSTLANSSIQDDGSNVSLGTSIDTNVTFKVQANSGDYNAIAGAVNDNTTGNQFGGQFTATGGSNTTNSYGIISHSNGGGASTVAVGVRGSSFGSGAAFGGATSIGVQAMAYDNTSNAGNVFGIFSYVKDSHANDNYGIVVDAANAGVGNAYIGKLQDGTEGSGKFLKSIDANGTAQWATITSGDISGSITDSAAIHDNVANEITAITEKTSIDNQDELIIEDSEASYVKKSVTRKTLLDPTIQSTASTATLTPNANEDDQVVVTALAANMTIAAPSGSPVQGQKLVIRIEDNGTSRTLTWNAIYEVVGVTLPTSTTASKKIYVGCIYNSTDTKWDVVAVKEEA